MGMAPVATISTSAPVRTRHGAGRCTTAARLLFSEAGTIVMIVVYSAVAHDGKLYTSKTFQEYYGSAGWKKWKDPKPLVEKRIANDGKAYTVHQFQEHYIDNLGAKGWLDKWLYADAEQRKANDG